MVPSAPSLDSFAGLCFKNIIKPKGLSVEKRENALSGCGSGGMARAAGAAFSGRVSIVCVCALGSYRRLMISEPIATVFSKSSIRG